MNYEWIDDEVKLIWNKYLQMSFWWIVIVIMAIYELENISISNKILLKNEYRN